MNALFRIILFRKRKSPQMALRSGPVYLIENFPFRPTRCILSGSEKLIRLHEDWAGTYEVVQSESGREILNRESLILAAKV